jgi:rhomboid family protein
LVFIPLHDTNPLKSIRFQYVTVAIIAINVLVYLVFQSGWVLPASEDNAIAFALVPAQVVGTHSWFGVDNSQVPPDLIEVPERFTLLTYMFLHGSWLHLFGNMLFLWVFGDNVEDAMGHIRFIMFYLICGISAGVVHTLMMPSSDQPLIGASGAIAGVLSAYLILHPKVKVWVLALWRIPIRISAFWALGFWILFQLGNLLLNKNTDVAWWAHAGGLVTGAVLILFMRRPGVPLFDRTAGGA